MMVYKKSILSVFLFIFCLFNQSQIFGQEQLTILKKNPPISYSANIVSLAQDYLDIPSDTSIHTVSKIVREYCKNEFNCHYKHYEAIVKNIQTGDKFWQAVPITEEIIKITAEQGDLKKMAKAVKNLADLHDFLGNMKEKNKKYQDLLKIYEQMGDVSALLKTKFYIIEGRIRNLGEVKEGVAELEELLAEAQALNLSRVEVYMQIRLKFLYEVYGYPDKLVKVIAFLETLPVSNPVKPGETLSAFHAASGRADLLMADKQYNEARLLYLKARQIVRPRHFTFHDTWLDIYALLRLADLEWEQDHTNQALSFLDSAYVLAEEGNINDHIISILEKRIEIAESENRFEEALFYTRKKYHQQNEVDSIAKGFDQQKYQLDLIRKQLLSENENQALALRLKESQLYNFLMITALFLLLLIGLFISRHKLQKDKKILAAQNTLIQQQTEELKQLDKAKTRFFTNISHELRTPLTVILGLSQIKKPYPDNHQIIQRNAKRLLTLVNELLDLSKLDAGNLKPNYNQLDLIIFAKYLMKPFQILAAQKNIQLNLRHHQDKILFVTDSEKLQQIVNNLLSNAIKFTPENGEVDLTITKQEKKVQMVVKDTGIGIPQAAISSVFDRFYQAEKPINAPSKGTGIGLSLVKELVELMEGTIQLESQLHKGTKFTIDLPLLDTENIPAADISLITSPLPPPPFSTITSNKNEDHPIVLIIEDDPDIVIYLNTILQSNYQVQSAENGEAGIKKAIEQIPDIIISDVQMPKKDGFKVVETLKTDERTNHIPIIMLTARVTQQDKLSGLKHGADAYLTKPFDQEELFIRLKKLLELRRVLQERYASPPKIDEEISTSPIPEPEFIQKIRGILENDIQSVLTVEELSEKMFLARLQVYRKVKALVGLTPTQLMNRIRLEHGAKMLRQTSMSISEIAYDIGYSDPKYFSRLFSKEYGRSPSIYRNRD